MELLTIRRETPADRSCVDEILRQAFGGAVEADLVETLRTRRRLSISLVAHKEGKAIGYVAFSPVQVEGSHASRARALGLAPLAVVPSQQGHGVGSRLVEAGVAAAARSGWDLIFVLGEPDYYGRFGFVTAAAHRLHWEQICPEPYFMVNELRRGTLTQVSGIVRYDKAFTLV
jgi:putative acetyltransferase